MIGVLLGCAGIAASLIVYHWMIFQKRRIINTLSRHDREIKGLAYTVYQCDEPEESENVEQPYNDVNIG